LGATNAAGVQESRLAGRPELFKSPFDGLIERRHDTEIDTLYDVRIAFTCEQCLLGW
jgi:hypothetical protein